MGKPIKGCAVEGREAALVTVVKGSEVQGRKHPGQGLSAARASDRAMSPGGCPGSALGRARFILLAGESDS